MNGLKLQYPMTRFDWRLNNASVRSCSVIPDKLKYQRQDSYHSMWLTSV